MVSPLSAPPPRPVPLPLRDGAIPAELTRYDHFVLWNYVLRNGRSGPAWTKPLYRVDGKGLAKSTDPDGWGSFRQAVAAHKARKTDGIGFSLASDDPFMFGDIDDCRDPDTGEIAAWAQPVLNRFRHSYQEVSPSGTGIKIIVKGRLPGKDNRWRVGPDPLAYIEWFSERKYTTLTGHRLDSAAPDIADAQAQLDALWAECRPKETVKSEAPRDVSAVQDDDRARLLRLRSSKQGPLFAELYDRGDLSRYGNNHSDADMALLDILAFWFGPDEGRIARIFQGSALWRAKSRDRADYVDGTIAKALDGRTAFYTPRLPETASKNGATPEPTSKIVRKTKWSADELLAAELPEPKWAVPDLMPEGLVILAGRPKKGKSLLALSVAISVASATPALGHFDVYDAGNVLFVALEDFERRLQDRLGDMLGKRGAPPTLEIWTACPRIGEGFKEEITGWLDAHPNARLIVLDTYQRIRPTPKGGDKNTYAVDYEDAALLQGIAIHYRVCTVLIQHTRKPTAGGDPFDEIMGTTGNAAAADALMVLQTERGRADAKLHVTGRDLAESEHAMTQDPATGRWIRIGEAQDVRRSGQREAILAALRVAGPDGLVPRDIAAATKQRGANVRFLLYRMRHDGEIVEHLGRYHVNTANAANALTFPQNPHTYAGNGVSDPVSDGVSDRRVANVSGVSSVSGMSDVSAVSGKQSWSCPCGASVVTGERCRFCGSLETLPLNEVGREIRVCQCGVFVPAGAQCHVCGRWKDDDP